MRDLLFYISFIHLVFWSVNGQAQQFNYVQFTKEQGLAGNIAYSITQDHQGFVWIGTENGVSRYDGHSFTNFTTEDGLTDNEVLQVICDSKGRVWFHCFSAPLCFYEKGKIYNPENSPHLFNGVKTTGMMDFNEDGRGIIWIRTTTNSNRGNFAYFDGNRFHSLDFESEAVVKRKAGVLLMPLNAFGVNNKGNYFFSSNQCIYEVDSFYQISFLDSMEYIPSTGISLFRSSAVFNKCDQMLYSYTNDVIFLSRYDAVSKLNLVKIFRNSFDLNRLIFDKRTCKIWVLSHGEGVYAVDSTMNKVSDVFMKNKNVGGILEDISGNMWFATLGEGVYFLNASFIKGFKLADNNFNNQVYSFAFNQKGNLFVGYERGHIEEYNGTNRISASKLSPMNLRSNIVKKILFDINDDPIFILENQVVYGYAASNKQRIVNLGAVKDAELLEDNRLVVVARGMSLIESQNRLDTILFRHRYTSVSSGTSDLYFFSSIDSLFRYENKTISTDLRYDFNRHGRIVDLCLTTDKTLWLCTYNNGVIVFYKDTVLTFNKNNGLLSNQCRSLYNEGNGNIWVVTDKGLSKISVANNDPLDYNILSLTINDGLPSEMIRQVLKRQDTLWIATDKGLAYFSEMQLKSSAEIPIYITSVLVNGKLRDTSIFAYNENRITFNFSAISFSSGKQIRFKYFMKGLNDKWTETDQRTVEFGSLEPGNYTFIVLAIDKNGNQSRMPARFSFSVSPPFWKRVGFQIVAINSGIILLVIGVKGRIKKVAKKVHEKQLVNRQLAEFKLEAVRAQMNPHFIFNCLNAIQHFNVNHDFDSAQQYLKDFAFLIRKTLYLSKRDFISLEEELEFLEAYLKLEKLRFEDQFRTTIEVDSKLNAAEVLVPSLLLQPFLENAINHGLKFLKNKNGELKVSFLMVNDSLEIIISDNGIGIKNAKELKERKSLNHLSQGITLASGRIEVINKIYKSSISFASEALDASNTDFPGTKIMIFIPLKPILT